MGCTPLHIAIQRGSTSVIEQLVEYGADVNAVNASDLSPLYLTIMYRDYFDVPSNACPKLKKVSKWFAFVDGSSLLCPPPTGTHSHIRACEHTYIGIITLPSLDTCKHNKTQSLLLPFV